MGNYNFDKIIPRKGTDCIKYDFAEKRGLPADVLPLWVADMDFAAPQPVLDALHSRTAHGIFGYSDTGSAYFSSLENWFSRRLGWQIRPEWLLKTPGIVFAVCMCIRALTNKGDRVLIQQPVYYPFASSIRENGRVVVDNPLVYQDGVYSIDFEDFEQKIVANQVKLFILCSPHNPVGRVWTEQELTRMGDICLKHGVKIVADEIHADFIRPGYKHTVFVSLRKEYEDITVTCTAPSKTFNLAGLQISNSFAPNAGIRRLVETEIAKTGYGELSIMGMAACQAAYESGESWLEELKQYLEGNLAFVRQFLGERLPQIKLVEPQGTYLIWLDCSALGMDDKALDDFIIHKAKLWLDGGTMFGAGGEGFQRVNIACPRQTLREAFERLAAAVATL